MRTAALALLTLMTLIPAVGCCGARAACGSCQGCDGCGGGCIRNGLFARAMDHHRDRYADPAAEGAGAPPTAQVAYPYYTNRGPRDFLLNNPPSIGY